MFFFSGQGLRDGCQAHEHLSRDRIATVVVVNVYLIPTAAGSILWAKGGTALNCPSSAAVKRSGWGGGGVGRGEPARAGNCESL